MTYLGKAILLTGALALGACTNAGRFGDGDGANAGSVGAQPPVQTYDPANDPTTAEYFRQSVGDRVFFAVDQSTLSPEARATLDAQAGWLAANPDYLAVIEGHADEQGTREYNIALGARRSSAVMEYLVSKGVPSSRMRTVSYGKERPVEICSEEACYAKNRRAVTVIAAGGLTG